MTRTKSFNRPLLGVLGAALIWVQADALAQAWPAKPVRIVVTFTPGSAVDLVTRTLSDHLHEQLGQTVLVENRPGASTTIGAAQVAKSEPDGYTILMTSSAHTVAPYLYTSLAYDTAADFAGVTPLVDLPTVLVVAPSKGFKSVQDLVATARAKPGSLTFASAAASTHLNAERFRRSAKFEAVHIPFKGAPEALTEVLTGRVDFYFSPIAPAMPMLKDGRIVALAVGSAKRSSAFPDVPTTVEAGFPDSEYNFWVGMFVPAKTPRSVIARLYQENLKALRLPAVRERIAKLGAETMTMAPEEFDAFVKQELATNAALVKAAGITAN